MSGYTSIPTTESVEEIDESFRPETKPKWRTAFRKSLCVLIPYILLICVLLVSVIRQSASTSLSGLAQNDSSGDVVAHTSPLEEIVTDDLRKHRPFSGAFSQFPGLSELKAEEKRITLIATWMHDNVRPYMKQFFHSVQLNADVVDLVFVNRRLNTSRNCIDFAAEGIDITWGKNIKVFCMDQEEWLDRHTNHLCSLEYGWNCNTTQRAEVRYELSTRPDPRNWSWRPLLGEIYRDFVSPDARYWGWVDTDSFLGRFTHFPFGILANSSLISGHLNSIQLAFLAGQLTAFNYQDVPLRTAWRSMPTLKTPEHFTKAIAGPHSHTLSEETDWSYHYLGVNTTEAGYNLTYALFHDMQGDDNFNGDFVIDAKTRLNETYLISGRDVIQISSDMNRRDIEDLLNLERDIAANEEFFDDHSSTGWSSGIDGSSEMIMDPSLSPRDAMRKERSTRYPHKNGQGYFRGILEDVQWQTGDKFCSVGNWIPENLRLCLAEHTLSKSRPSILRASFVHFKGQKPGHLFRRLERDLRPRGYSRKLLKHNLFAKGYRWLKFPPYPITEELAMTLNGNSIAVWKLGPSRDQTLFYRQQDGASSIG